MLKSKGLCTSLRIIGLLISLLWAGLMLAAEPGPAEGPPVIDLTSKEGITRLLASWVREGKAQWLMADSQQFLAIYKESEAVNTLGAVLILPDQYSNPDDSRLVTFLRKKLPDEGWATLVIAMPTLKEATRPKAIEVPKEETAAPNPEANQEADIGATSAELANKKGEAEQAKGLAALQELTNARLDQGVQFLREKGYKTILLLGHGSGGIWAAEYLTKHTKEKDLIGVVLLSAYYVGDTDGAMSKPVATLKVPVLDIHASDDLPAALSAAKIRALTSGREKTKTYRARVIYGADHYYYYTLDELIKIVNNWVNTEFVQTKVIKEKNIKPSSTPAK